MNASRLRHFFFQIIDVNTESISSLPISWGLNVVARLVWQRTIYISPRTQEGHSQDNEGRSMLLIPFSRIAELSKDFVINRTIFIDRLFPLLCGL